MNRWILLTVLAAAAGCRPTSAEIRCGKTLCATNQRCEPKQLVCVLDEAPTLAIEAPRPADLVAGDTLTLAGWVRDDNGASTVELSTDDGKSWVQVPLMGERFDARVAIPAADSQPFSLTLRAHDSQQQAVQKKVTVTVDNIAPTVWVATPVEGAKLNVAWFAAAPAVVGTAADGSGVVTLTVNLGDGEQRALLNGAQFDHSWAAPLNRDRG